jgi:non-ribosomal peptide synthetase-like protein
MDDGQATLTRNTHDWVEPAHFSSAAHEERLMPPAWSEGPTDPTLLRDELLHELFERHVELHPNRPAILLGANVVTYAELDRRANRLARHLRAMGALRQAQDCAGAQERVAILLPRSSDVYIALLAVLKAGASYVPLDPEYPPDRVSYILGDCGVHTLITTSELAGPHAAAGRNVVLIDSHAAEISRQPVHRLTRDEIGASPLDLCYVIYTSGSTGRPKGVRIEHRSAAHLVRAEATLFDILPTDRVFQGFSIAFDASVEEVWLALANGAALIVGTQEMVRSGPALSGMLTEAGVTVLSCVPTLLSMMGVDVPTLRLLIVGGEACPADLVRRWCRPGLRMVNTYGPTEATVIATCGDLHPDRPVTIGRPIPNYQVYILDDCLQPVAAGETGELYIGGPGVSCGYVERPDLDAERFVVDPFSAGHAARLYRTGDLGAWTSDGDIEFRGRVDSQIKLRGFRIELTEVESALMHGPGVLAAAVTVREDSLGTQQLVGYLVPRHGESLDLNAVRRHARQQLPAYMVPSLLEVIDEIPTMPSGKVDRRLLPRLVAASTGSTSSPQASSPQPSSTNSAQAESAEIAAEAADGKLLFAWRALFAPLSVGPGDDFFLDLGGHSLLAARLVSGLRTDADFQDVSVTDIYNHPTIESLAAELSARRARSAPSRGSTASTSSPQAGSAQPGPDQAPRSAARESAAESTANRRRAFVRCGWAQLPGLYLLLAFASIQWLAPFLVYGAMVERGAAVLSAVAGSLSVLLCLYPVMLAVPVAAKWLLLGRIRAGSYPLWGWYYIRWWFVHHLLSMAPVSALAGTPFLAGYLRLLGARIGRGVYLGTDSFGAFDLLTIGAGSSIGYDASLLGYSVQEGWLHVGPITIGAGCFVGTRSALRPRSVMEDGSSLGDLSLLPEAGVVPRGEKWVGSPARLLHHAPAAAHLVESSRLKSAGFALLQAIGVFVLPVVYLSAIFPGVLLLYWAGRVGGEAGSLLASPVAALCFVVCLCLLIAGVKWALLGRVRPGRYPLASLFYLRKWFVDELVESSLEVLGPLYATLYLTPWYRLLGVKLGSGAEISTACAVTPDLLRVDDESFIADSACLGAPHVEGGVMTLAQTHVGRRSFIGNSAVLPSGSVVGDNTLIGVLSTSPLSGPGAAETDTSWLGSPAIYLPQRQASAAFSPQQTYSPSVWKWCQRLFIEYFRVTLPATIVIMLATLLIDSTIAIKDHLPVAALIAIYPLLLAACGLLAAGFVVAAKWALVGRYRPAEHPLWSTFVWRTELLTALHEYLADPMLVELLAGTPFISWFFRLLGARVGTGVFMETTALTEFDLIDIGDDVALNVDCTVQTHLFEDRVMKMSTVRIGADCSVGTGSVVLYDSEMGPRSRLGDLSLLMKGEALPAGTSWAGTPARRAEDSPRQHALPCGCCGSLKAAPSTDSAGSTGSTSSPQASSGWAPAAVGVAE